MTTTPPQIEYIADANVDDSLDHELRALLSTCFTGAEDHVFKQRRYFNDPPAHRWIMRGEDRALAAHLALHERNLTAGGRSYPVGGVAEVCVYPAYRGRGYLKSLVAETHRWMRERGYAFSVLFGYSHFYASSGYSAVTNLYHDARDAQGHLIPCRAEGALAALLSATAWPDDPIAYLPGLIF